MGEWEMDGLHSFHNLFNTNTITHNYNGLQINGRYDCTQYIQLQINGMCNCEQLQLGGRWLRAIVVDYKHETCETGKSMEQVNLQETRRTE